MQESNQHTEQDIVESEEIIHDAFVEGVLDADQINEMQTVFDIQEVAATVAPQVHDRIEDDQEAAVPEALISQVTEKSDQDSVQAVFDIPTPKEATREMTEGAVSEIKIPKL